MRTIVRFRTERGEYALPVEQVAEVRRAADLSLLPAARTGVAGVIRRGDDVLTVLSVLGGAGAHVIVIDVDSSSFGLLVDEVTGVDRVADDAIGPAPRGDGSAAVTGAIVDADRGVVLLLDPGALRKELTT